MLYTIQRYISDNTEKGLKHTDISKKLGVSTCMVSSYKNNSYKPSITVAKRVYKNENIVLHPFAEESLIKEIKDDS